MMKILKYIIISRDGKYIKGIIRLICRKGPGNAMPSIGKQPKTQHRKKKV